MTIYKNPGKKTDWSINYKDYKLLPELQDAIWLKMRGIDPKNKEELLKKYNLNSGNLILLLSKEDTINLAKDLNL